MATGDFATMASIVAPSRSISTACPQIRSPVGTANVVVTPSMRVTAINVDAGLIPSATLKAAATSLPRSVDSFVPCTALISRSPIWPAPSINPGVTHLPVASMRVAPAGIATFVPTAVTRPPWISTVAWSIFGPDTG